MDKAALRPREFWILTLLAEQPLHGYALMKAIRQESGGVVRPGAATLYRALDQLHEAWLIRSLTQESQGLRARLPYTITPEGRARLRAEADRLSALELRARRSLGPSA